MGVRVAYGKKGRISAAIASGTIPRDSLIITSDSKESELYFYDANGEMKNISERKQFETLTEAQAWVKTYDCAGHIISVHNGSDWVPYIVSADGKLSPVNAGDISVGDVKVTQRQIGLLTKTLYLPLVSLALTWSLALSRLVMALPLMRT